MLFIFQTQKAQKLLLKISTVPKIVADSHVLDKKCLHDILSDLINLPDNGTIDYVTTIEGLTVLVWDFDDFTMCSNVTEGDFSFVGTSTRIIDFEGPPPDPSISLPYFILNAEKTKLFHADGSLKVSFMFPEVSESTRVEALRKSLESNNYNVERCDSAKTTKHYCEFSGGGDIFISRKDVSVPLVFVSPAVAKMTGPDEAPNEAPNEPSVVKLRVSPLHQGESKLASLSIEAKKGNPNSTKLRCQLWANMVILTVTNFMNAICPDQSSTKMSKTDLLRIKQVTGYGMACSGDGMVGAYKVEMKFDEITSFITKLELGSRERLKAAELMDFILTYYAEWPGSTSPQ